MNADLGKTTFQPEEIDALRAKLEDFRQQKKLSWSDLSTVTGIPAGTLSGWVPGTYNGGKIHETHSIAAKAHRFFLQIEERQQLEAVMPIGPDFQLTPTAQRMLTCLALAQLGDMALISTPPGCGKTAACTQYRSTRSQVWVTTAAPSIRGVPTLLIAILDAMGERGAKGTPQSLSARIRNRVRGAGALIVVDEAQHLSPQALDELRSIHDDTECGVALLGDETLVATLKKYPQLYSRLGVRHTQARPSVEDVDIIARAWGVERGQELLFLRDVAKRPGGIRTLSKTLKLAVRAARIGGAPLEITDLKDAFAQRYGEAA